MRNKTPIFNWDLMEFEVVNGRVTTAVDEEALKQIAIKAQQTARGIYLIYADTDTPELNHKYGSDAHAVLTRGELSEDARISELKRAVKEAILYDPWVVAISDVKVYTEADKKGKKMYYADYTLITIFDTDIDLKGVLLNE